MAEGAIGITFKVTRILQAACMIAVIGMESNFVSQIVASNGTAPTVIISTLSIVCVAVLYCIITFILYFDNLLPFLIATVVDGLFLVALIVVSVVVGRPLSYLSCTLVSEINSYGSTATSLGLAISGSVTGNGHIDYSAWFGVSRSTCLEMKSIWGLSIALCILFTLSTTTTLCLWKRGKKMAAPAKGEA